MRGLIRLILLVVATSLVLVLFTEYAPSAAGQAASSKTVILGLPVVSYGQEGAVGWLAVGQVAFGVLVIAQGGAGLVAFVQAGVGLFFGIGQLMFSLACIAQVGVGAFFFIGQGGVGAQALGQGVYKSRPIEYFKEMGEEFNALLSYSGR